ncbi:MAG: hypothetical protein ACRCV5_14620 [Afipia sp.]
MTRYVWKGDGFYDRKTGERMQVKDENAICKPYVVSDIPEYRSPIDGRPITSRSHRREDLKRNDCYEMDPPKRKRGLGNPRFAAKHGLPVCEEAASRPRKTRIDPLADLKR